MARPLDKTVMASYALTKACELGAWLEAPWNHLDDEVVKDDDKFSTFIASIDLNYFDHAEPTTINKFQQKIK